MKNPKNPNLKKKENDDLWTLSDYQFVDDDHKFVDDDHKDPTLSRTDKFSLYIAPPHYLVIWDAWHIFGHDEFKKCHHWG